MEISQRTVISLAQMTWTIFFAWPTWSKVEDASVSGAMATSASNMRMK
jgi:hypothetical protein